MANLTLSPSTSAKLKNRELVKKIRQGSPKLQELFRQRCRQRMRERRDQLFNRSRFDLEKISEDIQNTLTDIVRKELDNLSTTDLEEILNPFHLAAEEMAIPEEDFTLEGDIQAQEEEWILQEYEQMAREQIELEASYADGFVPVMCPICQKSDLIPKFHAIICESCDFKLTAHISMEDLANLIKKHINNHSTFCPMTPDFMLSSENSNTCLFIMCNTCSTWDLIV